MDMKKRLYIIPGLIAAGALIAAGCAGSAPAVQLEEPVAAEVCDVEGLLEDVQGLSLSRSEQSGGSIAELEAQYFEEREIVDALWSCSLVIPDNPEERPVHEITALLQEIGDARHEIVDGLEAVSADIMYWVLEQEYGIPASEVQGSDRVLRVDYKGFHIKIRNQTGSLLFSMAPVSEEDQYRDSIVDLDRKFSDLAFSASGDNRYNVDAATRLLPVHRFQREHDYREGEFYGESIADNMRNVMRIVEMDIEEVLALKGEDIFFNYEGPLPSTG